MSQINLDWPQLKPILILLFHEREGDCRDDANARGDMVPAKSFAEIKKGEDAKHRERNNFLDDFELERRVDPTAPTVRRHLEAVLKKGDAPAHQDHEP